MGGAVTRTKPEEFRRLAQECRATAQTLSTEQARAEMLAMADVCDRVAAQPTHGADVSDAGAGVRLMTRSTVVG
jgi:pyruvate-formate lyase